MFGSSIDVTVKREKLHGGRNIPKIISQCIGYLDRTSRLHENGIFRLPGNEKTVSLGVEALEYITILCCVLITGRVMQ